MKNMSCVRSLGLVLLALISSCALAQRHGRPDAVENYMRSMKPLS